MSKKLKFYDEKLLEKVRPIIELCDEMIITCLRVQNAARRNLLEDGVLVATETTVFLLIKIGHRYQLTTKFLWPSITKIILSSKNQIQVIHSGGGIILQTNDAPVIATQILGHLVNILPQNEVPPFEGDSDLITRKEPTSDAPYFRFLFLVSRDGKTPPRSFLKSIYNILKSGTIFDFAAEPGSQPFSEYLLDSIMVAPELTHISIPKMETKDRAQKFSSNWALLGKILSSKANPKLLSITICDAIDDSFKIFANSFKEIENSPIRRMKFVDTNLSEAHSNIFSEFYSASNINHLCFSNACNANFVGTFLRGIVIQKLEDKLQSLTLENMRDLLPNHIFINFPNIRELSINTCKIDVSQFLNSLSAFPKIEKLCFNNCTALTPVNKLNQLPGSLTIVSFTRIQFEQATFVDTWVLMMRHKPPNGLVDLTMCGCIVPDPIWEAFFNGVVKTVTPSLGRLCYESNPVLPQFIHFLNALPNLHCLSMTGCFKPDNLPIINIFGQFMKSNKTVTSLSIAGNEFGQMRATVAPFLRELIFNTTLKEIDLTCCNFGDSGYKALTELLAKNKRITSIKIKDNIADSGDVLIDFYMALGGRMSMLKFELPARDLERMKKKKVITEDHILQIKKLYKKIKTFKNENVNDEEDIMNIDEYQFATRKANSSETLKKDDWNVPFPELPPTDNTEIILQMRAAYAYTNLVAQFQASP